MGARALEERQKYPAASRPLTTVGIARARDLANGKDLSLQTLKRMAAFARQLGNYKPGERDNQGRLTKGTIAVMAWGGPDAIERWAPAQIRKLEK